MHRFFAQNFDGTFFTLEQDDLKQIKTVLKFRQGEHLICIFDGQHYEAAVNYDNNSITIMLVQPLLSKHESPVKITLIAGLIRGPKWDFLLQKATELGVSVIVPFKFERSVVQLKNENSTNKLARWQKICKEASEQSYRNEIPTVFPITNKLAEIKKFCGKINFVCYENASLGARLHDVLSKPGKTITFVIGPEGGLTPKEIDQLQKLGFDNVSLGSRILRAETASLAVLSAILYQKEL
ncbi:RsmE family RNA methyltransferase [Spiroplasma chrysopicola]|uniref:Ribosomal RNA small subunit methyltransferase E n=1 Tax=Spiroplasma chrysopicola DF-1 TaxID=1276227 RepID=R4UJ19_9MOLU|nr:RsmE family RNA methyltransferase [Spiroplasma chrysopicola]AGM25311.1 16S ribosomal RNA methyltransferase RsmE [Spiroplasma chrysopicola DF-1]